METNGSKKIHGDAGKGTILRLESRCKQSGDGCAVQGIGTPRPDCKSGRYKALSLRNEQGGNIGAGSEVRGRHERSVQLATRCVSIRSLIDNPFTKPSYDLGVVSRIGLDMRLGLQHAPQSRSFYRNETGQPFVT